LTSLCGCQTAAIINRTPIIPRQRLGADLGDPARVCDLDLG
jgi:hypothetical protein